MKLLLIFCLATVMFFASCKPETKKHDNPELKSTTQAVPKNRCFAYDHDDDLIGLTITVTGTRVSGQLAYAYSYKDRSSGTIEGIMKGDSLIAEYSYWSEGKAAAREIIFLNRDNALIEAVGEVEVRDGKTVYKNRSALKFDDNVWLIEMPCTRGGTLN